MAAGSAKGPSRSIELRGEPDAPTDWRTCRLALMEEEFFQPELAACKESGRATGPPASLDPGHCSGGRQIDRRHPCEQRN